MFIAERLSARRIIAQCGLRSRLEFLCMYVYVRTSGVARVCTFVHVCMYVRTYDVHIHICVLGFMCLACHESYMLHTHIRCCCTLCCCGMTPSLLGRDESAHTYAHVCLLGFTCLACVGPVMRATQAYICTNDVAHCATVARRHCYPCAMSLHKTASSAN